MCANCKPVGIKLEGDKLITVYTPANASQMSELFWIHSQYLGYGPDASNDWWNDMNYARTKADQ